MESGRFNSSKFEVVCVCGFFSRHGHEAASHFPIFIYCGSFFCGGGGTFSIAPSILAWDLTF